MDIFALATKLQYVYMNIYCYLWQYEYFEANICLYSHQVFHYNRYYVNLLEKSQIKTFSHQEF